MSLVSRRPTGRRVSRASSLGDWVDDLKDLIDKQSGGGQNASTLNCRNQADAATRQMEVFRLDLAKNWHPTGYYSPDQVQQLVAQAQSTLQRASEAVTQAMANMPDNDYDGEEYGGQHALEIKTGEIQRQFSESLKYVAALQNAASQNIEVIDSPGLREYVLSAMRTAESATWAAAFTQCLTPWWASVLAVMVGALRTLWSIAKAIVGVVIAIGQAVLKIPDAAATFMAVAKWALILGGGYYLAVRASVVPDTFDLKGI